MRLNGWQRLWVVAAGLWMLAVLVAVWSTWPTTAGLSESEIQARLGDVPDAEIRAALSPAENAILTDRFGLLAAKLGGHTINPHDQPDLTSVPIPDPAWLWTVVPTQPTTDPTKPNRGLPVGQTPLLSVPEFAHLVKMKYPEYAT